VVLTNISFATFCNLFVLHLLTDLIGPLLLNANLLLVFTTDYSDVYSFWQNSRKWDTHVDTHRMMT